MRITSMPRHEAITGPVETASAQVASRANDVSPPGAIPNRTSLAVPVVRALRTSKFVCRKLPAGGWGPRDVSTASAVAECGKREAPPGRCASVAGGLDGQNQGVVEEFGGGGISEASAFEGEHGVCDVSREGVVPQG